MSIFVKGHVKRKKPRGRPVKNVIKPINATPDEVLQAIFRDADKKIKPERSK